MMSSNPATSNKPIKRREAFTTKRSRFYEAIDAREEFELTLANISRKFDIFNEINKRWRKKRANIEDKVASRRSDKHRSEKSLKISDKTFDFLFDFQQNHLRKQSYEIMIDEYDLNIKSRVLEKTLINRRNARRFKKRKRKSIKARN